MTYNHEDALYNRNEATRYAVIQCFGVAHPKSGTMALQERLATERERCAKVCEQLAGDSIGKTFAAAIRSLK